MLCLASSKFSVVCSLQRNNRFCVKYAINGMCFDYRDKYQLHCDLLVGSCLTAIATIPIFVGLRPVVLVSAS